MENINFLRVAMAVIAAGFSFSHNISFAHGDALCQCGPAWKNGTAGCSSNCCGNASDAKQYDEKSAAEKEKRDSLDDKEKNEKAFQEKGEDFCRLKDCIDMSFYTASGPCSSLK